MFKSIDDKIKGYGFNQTVANEHCYEWRRFNHEFEYTQVVTFTRKQSGEHIFQSYDPELTDTKNIGNTCVGLTYWELKVFLKKFKQVKKMWDK